MAGQEWRRAISLAARLPRLDCHRQAILDAHGAYNTPGFYEQIGKDPVDLIKAGKAALQERFAKKNEETTMTHIYPTRSNAARAAKAKGFASGTYELIEHETGFTFEPTKAAKALNGGAQNGGALTAIFGPPVVDRKTAIAALARKQENEDMAAKNKAPDKRPIAKAAIPADQTRDAMEELTGVREKAPKAAKPARATSVEEYVLKPPKTGKAAEVYAAAQKGVLPEPPDFSAPTHARFRAKLAELETLVKARDAQGLRAVIIKATSTSPIAMAKYRALALMAIEG